MIQLGYLIRINSAKEKIDQYGNNTNLTKNALSGLDELKEDFIQELTKYYKRKSSENSQIK